MNKHLMLPLFFSLCVFPLFSAPVLSITSTPDKAEVWVDGKRIGTTPIVEQTFAAGLHRIILISEFFEEEVIDLRLEKDDKVEQHIALKPRRLLPGYPGPFHKTFLIQYEHLVSRSDIENLYVEITAKRGAALPKGFTKPAAWSWYKTNPWYTPSMLDAWDLQNLGFLKQIIGSAENDRRLQKEIIGVGEFRDPNKGLRLLFTNANKVQFFKKKDYEEYFIDYVPEGDYAWRVLDNQVILIVSSGQELKDGITETPYLTVYLDTKKKLFDRYALHTWSFSGGPFR